MNTASTGKEIATAVSPVSTAAPEKKLRVNQGAPKSNVASKGSMGNGSGPAPMPKGSMSSREGAGAKGKGYMGSK